MSRPAFVSGSGYVQLFNEGSPAYFEMVKKDPHTHRKTLTIGIASFVKLAVFSGTD